MEVESKEEDKQEKNLLFLAFLKRRKMSFEVSKATTDNLKDKTKADVSIDSIINNKSSSSNLWSIKEKYRMKEFPKAGEVNFQSNLSKISKSKK